MQLLTKKPMLVSKVQSTVGTFSDVVEAKLGHSGVKNNK